MSRDLFKRCDAVTIEKYRSFAGLEREFQQSLEGEAEYCVVDLETTGFSPGRDSIIEVAALKARGDEVTGRFSSLVDPGVPIPASITALTGIDDEMVAGSPSIEQLFDELSAFIGDSTLVAYSRLEEGFLGYLYELLGPGRLPNRYLDVMDLAVMLMPSLNGHRQVQLASIWDIPCGREHRAADDVETLFRVFSILRNALYHAPLPVLKALLDHSPSYAGALSVLLAEVVAARAGGRRVEALDLRQAVTRDRFWQDIPPLEAGPEHPVVRAGEVREIFSADGSLARQFKNYEERDEQLEMAEAVRRAFEERELVMVEAGTGTGKSLAYLAPAVLWSRASGLPVVVSTRTLNLQDQLYTKDLPTLEEALGDGSFRYSVLKGYSNYICLRKLQALASGRRKLGEKQMGILGMLLNWVGENETGDISLLNVSYLRGLEEHVMANHRECPGARCRFARDGSCFYRRALHRARRSHIVVVNHSLLLSGVNVPFKCAIIDEAHTLEDVATDQYTLEISFKEARRFLDSLYSPVDGAGFLADMSSSLSRHVDGDPMDRLEFEIDEVKEAVEICLEDLESAFLALCDFHSGAGEMPEEIRFGQGERESIEYSRLEGRSAELEASLEKLDARLRRVLDLVRGVEEGGVELEYLQSDLEGKAARAAELESGLDLFFSDEQDGRVRWATVGPTERVEQQSMKATPVHVGEILAEQLFGELESALLTSATLTVNGSFDFFASRIGLDLLDGRAPGGVVLDSSFDYRRQMQVLILHDMPEPTSPEYEPRLAEVISEAIEAAGGGALVLFTNRSLMFRTYELAADGLRRKGLPVLCQRTGHSRRRLTEEFVEDPASSLFGTASFWEGVDARGTTLKLVIVTRIPFESPGKPVFAARSELIRQQGGSDFMHLSLPLAALKLKQGVGRLIRTRTDRGQVLLLDSRISSMRYGQVLLRSLPGGIRRKVSLDEMTRAVSDFQGRAAT